MKVFLVIAALFAVCSSSVGLDWMRAKNLLREFRNFEAFEEFQRRASEPRCSAEADVVFILDRSRSIYPPDFEKGKVFVQDVVRLFSPTTSRFAVISFAEGATVDFSLSTYGYDQAATLTAIKGIEQRPNQGGQTQTWAALQLLYKQVLSSRNLRPGVSPTVLLITDGASQEADRTEAEAEKAHSQGIKIIAIGIGRDAKMSELKAIASDPDSEHVHMVKDYSESLNAIRNTVATQVCPSNIEGCDNNKPLDVMFSVSHHANAEQTDYTFDLMTTVMEKTKMGPGKVQFGLARRDCGSSWDQISLNEMDTVEGFKSEFSTRVSSFRNGLGLRLYNLAHSTTWQGDQANANNVAVVFIDKKSDITAQVKARASQMNGVRVIVMAGGDVTAADVTDISRDVIHFGSYDQLASKAGDLNTKLCEGVTQTQPNVTLNVIMEVTSNLECGDPGEVAGAHRTLFGAEWGVGTSVTYGCQDNYKHSSGNLTRLCLPSATWSGDPPVCGYVGAKVSLEALMAITGTLAVLVLILLPVEFLRYKIKQAQGREILKSAKSARNAARSMARQNPFMGTPVFSRSDVLLPDSNDAFNTRANYSSNSQTRPHFLPKLEDHCDLMPREDDTKKRTKKKRKKGYGASGGVSDNKGKVSSLEMGGDMESQTAMTTGNGVTGESHVMEDLNKSDGMPPFVRGPEDTKGMYYDNQVTLEDELQKNVYSLGHHKLPAIPPDKTTSLSIPHPSKQRPPIKLEGRDMRDFVV